MELEYKDSETATEHARRVREFVDEEVIPVERNVLGKGPIGEDQLAELREKAQERGLYAPQISQEYGGLGMSFRDVLPTFEEAGRSLIAPLALRVDAPDEGNMHLLELAGTDEQKEEWIPPLVDGDIKSAFSMTEPMQGGGSDPKMIKTKAEKDGDKWVINGHKWWTSQGENAEVLLVLARTNEDEHPYEGCSFFIVPADIDGVIFERGDVPHMSDDVVGMSHSEVIYDNVRIPEENLLGKKDRGFKYAQERLGPARLTHCMRFSGMSKRAIKVAKTYMSEREGFDSKIAAKQGPRFDIAEVETKLHAARSMIRHAADRIDEGHEARVECSMCKFHVANVAQEAIDTSLQFCGGNGISKDLPIADFYQNVRMFRIVDGADEVHKRVIARESFKETAPEELQNITRF